ncbi:metallophosphoesterase [Paenibacillus sp. EPM92]|uniref:metallophosphoesterase family protein n=1 Tax=Paenibacillus sp. EPM92 TaxID=1561195 RepID=UPI001915E91B|nr:metallophosphoesterase [Paenibacillus sp. EPM92]
MSFLGSLLRAAVCVWLLGAQPAAGSMAAGRSGELWEAAGPVGAAGPNAHSAAPGSLTPPAAGRSSPLTFAVLSDIHVQSWDRQAIRKFERALDDLHGAAPEAEALVLNGDLGDGDPEDYRTLQRLLSERPHPGEIHFTLGNHEFYRMWHGANRQWRPKGFPNGETEAAAIGRFLRFTGQPKVYRERSLHDRLFLFLGSERYRLSDPSYGEDAFLSEEQLRWLERRLQAEEPSGQPIFVFLHQPLPNTVAGSGRGRGVVQHRELRDILSRHPRVIVFSGHTHAGLGQSGTVVADRLLSVAGSSVSRPEYEGPAEASGGADDRSEGLVVRVEQDHVVIRGRDFRQGRWITRTECRFERGMWRAAAPDMPK